MADLRDTMDRCAAILMREIDRIESLPALDATDLRSLLSCHGALLDLLKRDDALSGRELKDLSRLPTERLREIARGENDSH